MTNEIEDKLEKGDLNIVNQDIKDNILK